MGEATARLTLGQKAGWGLADMGINVFVIVKQLLVFAYLTQFLGVPVFWAGLLTTSVLIFDVITDPLIGWLSDRSSSRFGRRAPFMFLGALLLAGATVGIFAGPDGDVWQTNLAWVGAFFVLATIGFTMVTIPYGAMAGEMTQDPRERSQMTAFRMAFASVGILIAGALIPAFAGTMGYYNAVLMFSPLIVVAVWGAILATRRAPRIDQPMDGGLTRMLGLIAANRAFVLLTILYGVMTLAIALITAGLPFAAVYLVASEGGPLAGAAGALGVLSLMFACFVVGSILSQAVWVWLSARLGKLWALVFGLCLYIALLFALFTLLPAPNVSVIGGMFILAGMTNGSYQQIPWAMYPDLMDVTRRETGQAIEGAFSALWLFGQKVANALAPLLLGAILAAYGFEESRDGSAPQTESALGALQSSITLIPAAILALAILGLALVYRPAARRALGT